MANTVIVGSQWGDEGKAKVIDFLTERADMVIRFQGGANAGHTVIADGERFIFHLVPSGIMYPGKACVVGNGVVFDAEQFFEEVDELATRGVSVDGRLFVSDLAHLVLPYHKELDVAMESQKAGAKIGTTGRGIGPAYADKVSRQGIRVGDLRDWDGFVEKLTAALKHRKVVLEGVYGSRSAIDADALVGQYRSIRERLLPMVTDTSRLVFEAARDGKSLLFEGAQGTFLDIDHGTYPFVTSSNTLAGSVCTGIGVGPSLIDHVVGIVKAYTTRVGNGPFPTELDNEVGAHIREVGQEFGATTGRPRRCGWFDSVMLRRAVQLNGMTRLALTKLDVLNGLDEVRICTQYRIDGRLTDDFPTDQRVLGKVEPVFEAMPGWKQDISAARRIDEMPAAARAYVTRLQELCYGVPLLMISVGPDRTQTITVEPV